jgi:hypothetical protein
MLYTYFGFESPDEFPVRDSLTCLSYYAITVIIRENCVIALVRYSNCDFAPLFLTL